MICKSMCLRQYVVVFIIGVLLNLAYTLLLSSHPISYRNMYAPVGRHAGNVWVHSDVPSYIEPAVGFLEDGAFLRKGEPDFRRTIGYPLFLSFCMYVAPQHWQFMVWVLQAIIFALIYPVLLFVAVQIFPELNRHQGWLWGLYAITGAGVAYSPVVMLTDQMANLSLWMALALGVAALSSAQSTQLWLLHILVLLYAANVRPTLMFFPFSFWLLAYFMRERLQCTFPSHWLCVLILLLQIAAVQSPAFRNYRNHGVWMPTDIMAINLADYLAYNVVRQERETALYESARADWSKKTLSERQKSRKTFALSVYRAYPLRTFRVMLVNGLVNTLESHWIMTRHFFRDVLRSDLRGWSAVSPGWRLFHGAWAVFHSILLFFAVCRFGVAIVRKDWSLIGFVILFSAPFLFSLTDAQGSRFRLYMDGLILMMAISFLSHIRLSAVGVSMKVQDLR